VLAQAAKLAVTKRSAAANGNQCFMMKKTRWQRRTVLNHPQLDSRTPTAADDRVHVNDLSM